MNTKNAKTTLLASFSAVMLIVGMMTAFNILSPKIALADPSTTSETANHFGQSASQLAQGTLPGLPGVQMGDHAKAGGAAGNPPNFEDNQPGRFGIGNVGNVLCPDSSVKLKPGQTADVLNGGSGNCPP